MGKSEIADIGEVELCWIDAIGGVVAIDQHPAGLTDRRRPEARAGPVRGAEVKGNAGNADRGVGSVRSMPRKVGGIAKVGMSVMTSI